jgi:hypothetical protein
MQILQANLCSVLLELTLATDSDILLPCPPSDSGKLGVESGTSDLSYFGAWICEILANAGHHCHRTRLVHLLEVDGIQNPAS